ncbi:hypothetical protein JX265_013430 [Neoarthrinium moseri]|uniref:Uncharacterized protein n=1 Tax=Neoarthrinium moseri TaxID=1658444 RepID=A0A9P9W8E1_9PEZI|nr:hypothetical protein JX266_009820 [Neoarthrinium moseri]KAI1850468.1 hypothetical protein JX265_013430 [Neoarthrinium moseri]
MLISQILLGLVATVSAIDIRLYTNGNNCGGANFFSQNANPDFCCSGVDINVYPSVGFHAIPTDWVLQCHGHANGRCNDLRQVLTARNTQDVCLTSGPFSGGGYGFTSRKRLNGATEACATTEGCTKHVKPDMLELEDGTLYRIAGIDDASLTEL